MLRTAPLLKTVTLIAVLTGVCLTTSASEAPAGQTASSSLEQELRRLSQWIGPSRAPERSSITMGLRN